MRTQAQRHFVWSVQLLALARRPADSPDQLLIHALRLRRADQAIRRARQDRQDTRDAHFGRVNEQVVSRPYVPGYGMLPAGEGAAFSRGRGRSSGWPARTTSPDGTWRCTATGRGADRCGTGRSVSGGERWVYSRLIPGLPLAAQGLAKSDCGYLAGRKETWIWMATPGAEKPRMSAAV